MEFLHENYGECSLVDECNILQRNKCPVSKYVLSMNNSNCCFNTSIIHSDEKDQIGFNPLRLPFDKMFELITALSFTTKYSNLLEFFVTSPTSECVTSMIFLLLCQSQRTNFCAFYLRSKSSAIKVAFFYIEKNFSSGSYEYFQN